jgi:hypothetical protein
MPAGRYLRTEILEWLQGTTFVAAPASVFLHLCTTAPNATTVGTAPTITGYAPVEIETADWAAISTGASVDTLSPTAAVTFGPFTGATQTATHAMLMDDADPGAGEILFYGALTASRAMVDGGSVVLGAGDVDVTA